MNSMVEGMANIKPISFILKDSENHLAIKNVGNRTEVEVDTAWLNSDNSKDGTFVTLKKYANGWKIKGMGNP
ncbi:hypothetical protein [Clostridium ljungdahlii]